MAFEKIEKPTWKTFLDHVSKTLEGRSVSFEVAGLDVGDQIDVGSLSLRGITYDPAESAVYVEFETRGDRRYDRVIRSPSEVHVEVSDAGLSTLVFIESDGRKEFLRLVEPLKLPMNAAPPPP